MGRDMHSISTNIHGYVKMIRKHSWFHTYENMSLMQHANMHTNVWMNPTYNHACVRTNSCQYQLHNDDFVH